MCSTSGEPPGRTPDITFVKAGTHAAAQSSRCSLLTETTDDCFSVCGEPGDC